MDEARDALVSFLVIVVLIFSLIAPYLVGRSSGYRNGQIDALNGAIYYKLEKQSDNEFRWVECPGICRYGKEGK